MPTLPLVYRCRSCGATSYQRLVHRAADGSMTYSGLSRCSGCPFVFTRVEAWRERRLRPRAGSAGSGGPQAMPPGAAPFDAAVAADE